MEYFQRGTSFQIWCEYVATPFAYVPYVGEFWNTVSNVFYLFSGAWGIWQAKRHGYSWPFIYSNAMLLVVGAGSFVFHATQSFAGQMLDEIPMALMGLGYMWCTFDMHWLTSTPYKKITAAVFHGFVFGAWYCYLAFHNYEIFQIAFTFQVAAPAIIALFSGPAPVFSAARWKWWLFLLLVGIGRISWDWERYLQTRGLCSKTEWDIRFWLHAIWHLCSSTAHMAWMSYAGDLELAMRKSKAA